MGRPARGVLRLSQEDQAANTRREREQRCDHAHGQLIHHAAEHPVRAANHLPRLQSWVAVSISRAVCAARHAVPEWLNTSRKSIGGGKFVTSRQHRRKQCQKSSKARSLSSPEKAATALDRYGHVDEITAAVAFIAGPESSYITGSNLTVDGGMNA